MATFLLILGAVIPVAGLAIAVLTAADRLCAVAAVVVAAVPTIAIALAVAWVDAPRSETRCLGWLSDCHVFVTAPRARTVEPFVIGVAATAGLGALLLGAASTRRRARDR